MIFDKFKKMLGFTSVDYDEILERGGIILDVRTPQEYQTGHILGSMNIPLQSLPLKLNELDKNVPIITCCASGIRSASAKSILKANQFKEVYNGGGWGALNQKI